MACLFDTAFLLSAAFITLYLCARGRIKSRAVSLVFAAAALGILLVGKTAFDRKRYLRHKEKLRQKAEAEARAIKLMTEPGLLSGLPLEEGVAVIEKTDILTADDILDAVKKHGLPLVAVTPALPTERARAVLGGFGGKVRIRTPEEHFKDEIKKLIPVSEQETDDAIIKKYGRLTRRPKLDLSVFRLTRDRAAKYALVGAGLTALSFFSRFALYFRLTASVCLALAALFFGMRSLKRDKSEY